MDGITVGVFGTDQDVKAAFESAVAKKSEAEGISVYTRTEGGRRYSLLDTGDFPGRVQGYAKIASIADHALYLFPRSGRLSPADGELAVLVEAFGLPGTLEILDRSTTPEQASSFLRGTAVSKFLADRRQSGDAALDLSRSTPRQDLPGKGTIVYIDRVFTVKGVGTVALGFVLSGTVKLHDQLRPIPGPSDLRADVRGIQVNDVDFDSVSRGIRVGLSLRGMEPSDLEKSHWLDDGSFQTSSSLSLDLAKSPFYRQETGDRDLHIQLSGEMVPSHISSSGGTKAIAQLPMEVPVWGGMRTCVVDLNGGNQRIVGGATVKF
jgi:selenocysteine-specific translation elongation factor